MKNVRVGSLLLPKDNGMRGHLAFKTICLFIYFYHKFGCQQNRTDVYSMQQNPKKEAFVKYNLLGCFGGRLACRWITTN